MTSYRVKWLIDIDAESPEKAALQALRIQLDPTSTATVFEVVELTNKGGCLVYSNPKKIDLSDTNLLARLL